MNSKALEFQLFVTLWNLKHIEVEAITYLRLVKYFSTGSRCSVTSMGTGFDKSIPFFPPLQPCLGIGRLQLGCGNVMLLAL